MFCVKGSTPLHIACFHNHKEIVQILLENDAKHNIKDENGWIPIHYAVIKKNKEVVNLLISKGSDVNTKTISIFV